MNRSIFKFFVVLFVLAGTQGVCSDRKLLAAASTKSTDTGDELAYMKAKENALNGNYDAALPFYEQALKNDPESPKINDEIADVLLRLNNAERAETYSKKAVDKEPANIDFRGTLAGIYAAEKKYTESKEQYLKIMELDPSNSKVPLLIGILDAESGNMEGGIKTLTKTIEGSPENVMAYFYRAKIYLEMEEVEKAEADLDKALSLRPSFVEAGTALGMIYERLNDNDKAINVYGRIQGSGRYQKRLGQLYLSKNDFDKALDQFIDYEKVEPDDYSVKVKIGLIYVETKKYEKAVEKFQSILKEQPDAENVRFYLAVTYEEMKKPDLAIHEFKRVGWDSGFYKEAMLHVGFILKDLKRTDEGLKFAKGVLNAHKDVEEFYDMYASFYEFQKDYKKALAVVADGLKRFPKAEKLLYFEGALLDKTGNRAKAIADMKKILEVNGDNAHALNFLGYTYAEMGDHLDEALGFVEKALKIRPNDGYIQDSQGWVLFKMGKSDEAIAKLQAAAGTQPDEPVIFEHLGDVYQARKDFSKATEMYKKSVQLASARKDKESQKKVESKLASMQKEHRVPTAEVGKTDSVPAAK